MECTGESTSCWILWVVVGGASFTGFTSLAVALCLAPGLGFRSVPTVEWDKRRRGSRALECRLSSLSVCVCGACCCPGATPPFPTPFTTIFCSLEPKSFVPIFADDARRMNIFTCRCRWRPYQRAHPCCTHPQPIPIRKKGVAHTHTKGHLHTHTHRYTLQAMRSIKQLKDSRNNDSAADSAWKEENWG